MALLLRASVRPSNSAMPGGTQDRSELRPGAYTPRPRLCEKRDVPRRDCEVAKGSRAFFEQQQPSEARLCLCILRSEWRGAANPRQINQFIQRSLRLAHLHSSNIRGLR